MPDIIGVDLSHWNGIVNWDKLQAAGIRFAFLKCSEGAGYGDDKFGANYAGAVAHGIKVGAYHFVRMNVNARLQFQNIQRALGTKKLDFFALDVESNDGQSSSRCTEVVWSLAGKCKAIAGAFDYPFIYTRRTFWDTWLKRDKGWADCPLWVAHWDVAKPVLPADWTKWTVWQYTTPVEGAPFGVNGKLDLNKWNPAVPFPGDVPEPPVPPEPPTDEPDHYDVSIKSKAGKQFTGRVTEVKK